MEKNDRPHLEAVFYANAASNPHYAIAYAIMQLAEAIEDLRITVGENMEIRNKLIATAMVDERPAELDD